MSLLNNKQCPRTNCYYYQLRLALPSVYRSIEWNRFPQYFTIEILFAIQIDFPAFWVLLNQGSQQLSSQYSGNSWFVLRVQSMVVEVGWRVKNELLVLPPRPVPLSWRIVLASWNQNCGRPGNDTSAQGGLRTSQALAHLITVSVRRRDARLVMF